MKLSQNRPWSRLRSLVSKGVERLSRASGLVRAAGGVEPLMEPLENRQLLFSLTIEPGMVNGNTGVGTTEAFFGYFLPRLSTTLTFTPVDDEIRLEEFTDDARGLVVSGRILNESFLQLNHTINPGSNIRIQGAVSPQGQPINETNHLYLRLNTGQNINFRTVETGASRRMRSYQVDILGIDGSQGINLDNFRVELRMLGTLVSSWTGASGAGSLGELNTTLPGSGIGTFVFASNNPQATFFDEIRFIALNGPNDPFVFDNIQTVIAGNPFDELTSSTIFGAMITFTGPVGATISIFDLYNRPMVQTIALGPTEPNGQIPIADPDGNGVPNFNDGIGRIVMTGTDGRSALTVFGGLIVPAQGGQNVEFVQDGYAFQLPATVQGIYDDMEEAGYGYRVNPVDNAASGLPDGPGSVLIGAPWVRNNASTATYNPFGPPQSGLNFNFVNPSQGIFVQDGSNFGSVYVHGAMHGSSKFNGFLQSFYTGNMLGSLTVRGDLGSFVVGGDAGIWEVDPDFPAIPAPLRRDATSGQLIVERTLGEMTVAGRMYMDVTVRGDLNSPVIRPARDVLNYFEKERPYEILRAAEDGQRVTLRALIGQNDWLAQNQPSRGSVFTPAGQTPIFAGTFSRNDRLLSSEWVGSIGTAVQIHGSLGGADPVNTAVDGNDIFAFAADGTREVVIELDAGLFGGALLGLNARVVDAQGRVLAALRNDLRAAELANPTAVISNDLQTMRFTPDGPGAYYLILHGTANPANDEAIDFGYLVTINGMASTTLGLLRSGAQTGSDQLLLQNTIGLLGGNAGSVRVGTGYTTGGGGEVDPIDSYNEQTDDNDADARLELKGCVISIPGTLFDVTTGSDIEGSGGGPARFIIGGDLGRLTTGMSPVAGDVGPDEGDVGFMDLQVGGRIGFLNIKGSIGIDQDAADPNLGRIGPVTIRTGLTGTSGDIGLIRLGEHMAAGFLTLVTSPGSIVGGFLIGQDRLGETGGVTGIYGPGSGAQIVSGFGSNIRFVDFARIDLINAVNAQLPLISGQQVTIVDDAGGSVRIEVTGVPSGVVAGFVRVLPVDGSQGVAIGQIDADLTGGRALVVTSLATAGVNESVNIGRINILGGDAGSNIRFLGPGEIDVYAITQVGGDALAGILNETPGGDIVSVDVVALTTFNIRGNLGSTQMPAFGPQQIGPFLGIAGGLNTTVGGVIGVPALIMAAQWNGQVYRPTFDFDYEPAQAFLSDIGSPVDPFLNGLMVRTGNVTDVFAGGSIGDVILQGGNITQVIANFDTITPLNEFHGITGSVYATDIGTVRVGDGIAGRGDSPFGAAGVVARDDITLVTGPINGGAPRISGLILAGNINFDVGPNGIAAVNLPAGGDFIDAYIASEQLDGWWVGAAGYQTDLNILVLGDIATISGTGADMFHSEIRAVNITNVALTGGVWDATLLDATNRIGTIRADAFRNSTLQGQDREFFPNAIIGGENLGLLTTGLNGAGGDITDMRVDLIGSVTGGISARNIIRFALDVDNTIASISTSQDLRASRVVAGRLNAAAFGRFLRTSEIIISGPIVSLTAVDSITDTRIQVTGPDGRIDLISTANLFTGSVAAAGPITTILVTAGDMRASIRTTTSRGTVGSLIAGRDLDIETDISAAVGALTAGRDIGRFGDRRVILIRGDLGAINGGGGQLFSDVRIGQNLTGTATIGRATHLPSGSNLGLGVITAYGSINTVRVLGDFGGRIVSHSGGITLVSINDGSLLPGGLIAAFDGSIINVVINRGHLLGDIHADYTIFAINVNASDDGVFGDIGVNPDLNPNTVYDAFRNQLPPGVIANFPIQGPRITAGHNIGRVTTSNGSVFEALFHAGRAIGTFTINGDVRNDPATLGLGSVIAAGSTMFRINVTGNLFDAAILAGVKSFGTDGRPGGVGTARDTNHLGRMGTIDVGGDAANSVISAGLTPGTDGIYNTADDAVVPGLSFVRNVLIGGAVTNVSAFSDFPIATLAAGVVAGGFDRAPQDPRIVAGAPLGVPELASNGTAFNFTTLAGEQGTLRFTGPGRAFWDAANNRVVLINTKATSDLLVTSATGTLTDFRIVSNDDATMGTIQIGANLLGDSSIVIDNNIVNVQFNNAGGAPQVVAGGNIRNLTTGNMSGGLIQARFARTVNIVGSFGLTTDDEEIAARFLALGDFTVGGQNAGAVLVERDAFNFRVTGAMSRAIFRAGGNLGTFTVGSLSESRVSVTDRLGPVVVSGNMFDTSILAGGDLGEDGAPGGTGFNADRATTGQIVSVFVGGTFVESDVVAGVLRGADGFFGTTDDAAAAGRSTVGAVTVVGTAVGSNLNTEQYRITSTGTLGTVLFAGQEPTNTGNLISGVIDADPVPIVVDDVRMSWVNGFHQARIYFNQPMDSSTIAAALRIAEVRDSGNTLITLAIGTHYTFTYDAPTNSVLVTFDRSVTDRNLPQGGNPGPGVYRFTLNGSSLRAAVVDARLDGDADGFVDPTGDDYSTDNIVGDAGDKLAPTVITLPNRVDFYGPVDMDLLLDDNVAPDGLAEVNRSFTVRGAIGDHPDNEPNFFSFSGDVDVYRITLRAGQILQLGALEGSALFTGLTIFNAAGQAQFGDGDDVLLLASDLIPTGANSVGSNYLIRTTGTFYVVVGNVPGAFLAPTFVPNLDPIAGGFGDYGFTLSLFDDLDTGFAGDTDSGDGADLVNAPLPIAFAGADQQFGTSDDLTTVTIGTFNFGLDRGADGLPNTADDVVSGTNGLGLFSERRDGRLTTSIRSAIGTPGHIGVPGDVIQPDVDIFNLNLGQPIAPGTRYTITVKLSEAGADLGGRSQATLTNWNSEVQFGVFDTTTATDIRDALMVFSPSDFTSSGGAPGTSAANGPFSYGHNADGDFFITFVTPGRLGVAGSVPASYAVYLQGVFNTDYVMEIVQDGTGSFTRPKQNVFIETRGGSVDWLEVGGLTTQIGAFSGSTLGFTGTVSGQGVDTYILSNLVAQLTAIFNAAGVDVVISTDPNAFEFQDFSTVFLASTNDPIRFFNERNFGATERSDPFNTDRNDEAVVFVPSFGTLGFTPSVNDVNDFVDSLTGAVARRIGELNGLRFTEDAGTPGGDPMASNSPENFGGAFTLPSASRPLSGRFDLSVDQDFYLGNQAAVPLLNRILRP
ncbi:MAG: beta strand repeat-containing protein [Phycisphaerales bacterium]